MLKYDHTIVLIDLTMLSKESVAKSFVGTRPYKAPEVQSDKSSYDPKKAVKK